MHRTTLLAALISALAAPAAAFVPGVLRSSRTVQPRAPAARLSQDLEEAPTTGDLFTPVSDMELAEQEAKLQALSDKWKTFEEEAEYMDTIRSGWGPSPERINGRAAMFFLVTGLITEYYTGQSMPQQVYTMLQTLAIVE